MKNFLQNISNRQPVDVMVVPKWTTVQSALIWFHFKMTALELIKTPTRRVWRAPPHRRKRPHGVGEKLIHGLA